MFRVPGFIDAPIYNDQRPLICNRKEITNYHEIYIQHVTKERNYQNTGERKEKEYTLTSK